MSRHFIGSGKHNSPDSLTVDFPQAWEPDTLTNHRGILKDSTVESIPALLCIQVFPVVYKTDLLSQEETGNNQNTAYRPQS